MSEEPSDGRSNGLPEPADQSRADSQQGNFGDLGTLADLCPYCRVRLAKRPKARSRCTDCGETIFIIRRPLDRRRVLATAEDRDAIEAEWETVYPPSRPAAVAASEDTILSLCLQIVNEANHSEVERLVERVAHELRSLRESATRIERNGSTTTLHRYHTCLARFLSVRILEDESIRFGVAQLVVQLSTHHLQHALIRWIGDRAETELPWVGANAPDNEDDLDYSGGIALLQELRPTRVEEPTSVRSASVADSTAAAYQCVRVLLGESVSEAIQDQLSKEDLLRDPNSATAQIWEHVQANEFDRAHNLAWRLNASGGLSTIEQDTVASLDRLAWILRNPHRKSDLWWQHAEVKADSAAAERRAKLMIGYSRDLGVIDAEHAATGMLGFALERMNSGGWFDVLTAAIEDGSTDSITFDRVSLRLTRERRYEEVHELLRGYFDHKRHTSPRLYATLVKRLRRADAKLGVHSDTSDGHIDRAGRQVSRAEAVFSAQSESSYLFVDRAGGPVTVVWESNVDHYPESLAVRDRVVSVLNDGESIRLRFDDGSVAEAALPPLGSGSSRLREWIVEPGGWDLAIYRTPYSAPERQFRLISMGADGTAAGESTITTNTSDVLATRVGDVWAFGYGAWESAELSFVSPSGQTVGHAVFPDAPIRALGTIRGDAVVVTRTSIGRYSQDGTQIWEGSFTMRDRPIAGIGTGFAPVEFGPESLVVILESGFVLFIDADGAADQMPPPPGEHIYGVASIPELGFVAVREGFVTALNAGGSIWEAEIPVTGRRWVRGIVATDGGVAVWGTDSILHFTGDGELTHDLSPVGDVGPVVAHSGDLVASIGSRLVRLALAAPQQP